MTKGKAALYFLGGVVGLAAYKTYSATTGKTGFVAALDVLTNLIGAFVMSAPASKMQVSANGLAAIANREGFSAYSYPDANGRSIGHGHFIKATDNISEPISESDAYALLSSDAQTAADAVRAYVNVPLTQNQFDSLVSFVYNIGAGAFKNSTLLRMLNAGDYSGAASQFSRWNLSQGQVVAALVNRRVSESQQFLA